MQQGVETLGDEWNLDQPTAKLFEERLKTVTPTPLAWVVINRFERKECDNKHDKAEYTRTTHCALIDNESDSVAKALHNFSIPGLGKFDLRVSERSMTGYEPCYGLRSEKAPFYGFFTQVRDALGSTTPEVDILPSFLWFWDVYRVKDEWKYTDATGKELPLLRFTLDVPEDDEANWKLEARALELRTFLYYCDKELLLYTDDTYAGLPCNDDARQENSRDWCSYTFMKEPENPLRKSVIALFGKYIIHGAKNTQFPRFLDDEATTEYPSFIIGLASDGKPIPASCDPSQLSGYPSSSPNHPNKLEQVCFKPEVLQRYSANPDKYQVSDRSVACVIDGRGLWQLDIDINSEGLVEAHLGDLSSLPREELQYWESFNITPSGNPNPNRVLRDYFNIPSDFSDAPVFELMLSFKKASENVKEQLGVSIWKEPDSHTLKKINTLAVPTVDSTEAFNNAMLALTKALADTLDGKQLRKLSGIVDDKIGSIQLAASFFQSQGADTSPFEYLKYVQDFRSGGGAAHRPNGKGDASKRLRRLLGDCTSTDWKERFVYVCNRLTDGFNSLAAWQIQDADSQGEKETSDGKTSDR